MKLKHLKKRSIINVYNGNFMGYIIDVNIKLPEGNLESLIIKLPFFKRITKTFSKNTFTIPWNNIVSIGKDVILVNIIDN